MKLHMADSKPSHSMNPRDIVNQNGNKMIFQSCSWLIWHLAWCLSCLQVCYLIHYNRLYSIRYSYILPSSHWVKRPSSYSRELAKDRGLLKAISKFLIYWYIFLPKSFILDVKTNFTLCYQESLFDETSVIGLSSHFI